MAKTKKKNDGSDKIKVTIMGNSYTLVGGDSPEEVQAAAWQAEKVIQDTIYRCPRLNPNVQLILAAVNIAEELVKVQNQYNDLVKEHARMKTQIKEQVS